jgi:cell shape-determining protein MreD
LAFIFAVLDTTLFAWWSLGPLKMQPLIPLVVSAGFNLPLLYGGVLTLFIGYVSDVLSAGVVGLEITAYQMVFLSCAMARMRLEINSWPLQMMAVGLVSLMFQAIVALGLSLVEREHLTTGNLSWVMTAQALLCALTAPIFFGVLEFFTHMLRKMWPKDRRLEL